MVGPREFGFLFSAHGPLPCPVFFATKPGLDLPSFFLHRGLAELVGFLESARFPRENGRFPFFFFPLLSLVFFRGGIVLPRVRDAATFFACAASLFARASRLRPSRVVLCRNSPSRSRGVVFRPMSRAAWPPYFPSDCALCASSPQFPGFFFSPYWPFRHNPLWTPVLAR